MLQSGAQSWQRTTFGALILATLAGAALLSITLLAGTKTGLVLGLGAVAGPVLLYAAIVAPMIFPFCLYVVLVPFDNVLNVSAFGTLTKMLGIVSGAAILFFLLRTHRAVRPPRELLIFYGLYFWMALTAFWAIDPPTVFALLPTAISLLVLYTAICVFPADDRSVRWVALSTIAGGVVAAGYGAYLFHAGMDVAGARLWITTDTSAIDPNHFAAALLLPTALSVAIAMYARRPLVVVVAIAAALMLLVGVAESGSRGAAIGVGVMFLYMFLRSSRKFRLGLAGVPIAIGVAITSIQTPIWNRFSDAVSSGGSGRLPIWKVGISALKEHWLLGAGYNNFAFAYDQVLMQTHQFAFEKWHRAPHDIFIATSVELGVVGMVLMLALWISQFRMLRSIPPNDPDYPIRLACEATVLATFV
ncbi:MAG TPA: O-antigen ligase family protein, partial [Candidatus Acidoferrales bacterium]|nr:O-antigen ligase family protein [Candidatus Acidoferrales bacterium]